MASLVTMIAKVSVLLLLIFQGVLGNDLPCAKRETTYGFVCVCNSSYCDTVGKPTRLSNDQYYVYETGKLNPGITRTTGTFLQSDSQSSGIEFKIDSSVKYQEILGFGGSFTDSAGIVYNSLPQGAREKFIESYFSENGVEYSAGRVPIGMADFSPRIYTYDDTPDDVNLNHFALQEEDFQLKIPLIQEAQKSSPHPLRLVASPFTAPVWMKMNEQMPSSYIKTQYQGTWAKYLVKFLESYRQNGIEYWVITEGNEGAMSFELGSQMGLGNLNWPMRDRNFLKKYLGPQMRAANFSNVKYAPLDDQRTFAKYFMKKFTTDPEVSELVAGVALHWYWDWTTPVEILDELHDDYPDKLILYTESSINTIRFGGESVQLGDWARGAWYIYNIMENVNHWANAYVDWNLALNLEGGPDLGVNIDAAIIVNATSGEFYKNPMFYGMGIFSKFIPPGAFRVNVTSNQKTAKTTDQGRELLKKHHLQKKQKKGPEAVAGATPFPLPTFPPYPAPVIPQSVFCVATVNPDQSTTVILYNAKEEQAEVSVVDATVGTIKTTIPANTVHTIVYWPKQN